MQTALELDSEVKNEFNIISELLQASVSKRGQVQSSLGTRGFSRVRREFSVLAEGRHIFGRRPKPRAAFRAGPYKDLTETGNRAKKVSSTQGKCKANDMKMIIYSLANKLIYTKKVFCT